MVRRGWKLLWSTACCVSVLIIKMMDADLQTPRDPRLMWKHVSHTVTTFWAQQLQRRLHLTEGVDLVWDQLVMCSLLQTAITADDVGDVWCLHQVSSCCGCEAPEMKWFYIFGWTVPLMLSFCTLLSVTLIRGDVRVTGCDSDGFFNTQLKQLVNKFADQLIYNLLIFFCNDTKLKISYSITVWCLDWDCNSLWTATVASSDD